MWDSAAQAPVVLKAFVCRSNHKACRDKTNRLYIAGIERESYPELDGADTSTPASKFYGKHFVGSFFVAPELYALASQGCHGLFLV